MSTSDAVRKHKEFLFPAVAMYYQEPIALVKGEGNYVWDDQGNRYEKINFFPMATFAGVTPEDLEDLGGVNPFALEAAKLPQYNFKLVGKEKIYLKDDAAKDRFLAEKSTEHKNDFVRLKGLGEMDGEELWETTLDPEKRMLLQVHLDDAFKADEMFRILMGEKVEPRREFIQKHALEVKDIDYHGA